jgi:mannose-6-phosphate isomerase-like protein (cupin superfamily)
MEAQDRGDAAHLGPGEGLAVRMPGAQLLTRKVGGARTGGAFSLFEVAVRPGGGQAPHIQHEEDECFYVLEGRFAFLIERDKTEAVPGSLLYVPKGTLHAFENVGGGTGKLLMSQTPGGLHERFVEETGEPVSGFAVAGSDPSAGGPPRNERFAAKAAEYGIETVLEPYGGHLQ